MSISHIYFVNSFKITLVTIPLIVLISVIYYIHDYRSIKKEAKKDIEKLLNENKSLLFGKITKEEHTQYDTLRSLISSPGSRKYSVNDPKNIIKDKTIGALLDLSTDDIFQKYHDEYYSGLFGSQYMLPIRQNDLLRYVLRELNTVHLEAFTKAAIVHNEEKVFTLIEKSITTFLNDFYEGEEK